MRQLSQPIKRTQSSTAGFMAAPAHKWFYAGHRTMSSKQGHRYLHKAFAQSCEIVKLQPKSANWPTGPDLAHNLRHHLFVVRHKTHTPLDSLALLRLIGRACIIHNHERDSVNHSAHGDAD